jgi:serine/threonine protein kinase
MGDVFLAEQIALQRQCAIKIVQTAHLADARSRERFAREAASAARFSHPNIATVYDYFEDDGRQHLVMEFVQGATLDAVVARNGPLPATRVAGMLDQIAAGVDAAHAHGIIHRDLKPSNVILTTTPTGAEQLKLLDFGIAWLIGSDDQKLTVTGGVIGTPAYLAPEQFIAAYNDALVDVYSLGVLAVFLLAGRLPPTQAGIALRLETLPEMHALPPRLREALARATTADRTNRWPSAGAFADAFRSALAADGAGAVPAPEPTVPLPHARGAGGPAPAGHAGGPVMPTRDGWRSPWALAGGFAVAAAAGVGVLMRSPKTNEPAAAQPAATRDSSQLVAESLAPVAMKDSVAAAAAGTTADSASRVSIGTTSTAAATTLVPDVRDGGPWPRASTASAAGLLVTLQHPPTWRVIAPRVGDSHTVTLKQGTFRAATGELIAELPDSVGAFLIGLTPRASGAPEAFLREWEASSTAGTVRAGRAERTGTATYQAVLWRGREGEQRAGFIFLTVQQQPSGARVLWRAFLGDLKRAEPAILLVQDSLHVGSRAPP